MKKKCISCGKPFRGKSVWQQFCDKCHENHDKLKGGQVDTNMAKKEKAAKQDDSEKMGVKKRVELAEKTLDYLQNTLKVPDEEISKVLSRAFTIVRKSMK